MGAELAMRDRKYLRDGVGKDFLTPLSQSFPLGICKTSFRGLGAKNGGVYTIERDGVNTLRNTSANGRRNGRSR